MLGRKVLIMVIIASAQIHPAAARESLASQSPKCDYDINIFLQQDFETFDQSQNGWRKISALKDCEEAGADLISQYRLSHGLAVDKMALANDNRPYTKAATLYFHEAQLRAEIGHISVAKDYFTLSMHESTGDWNIYVKATIAFLEKDRKKLKKLRDELAILPVPKGFTYIDDEGKRMSGKPDWWPANLNILDSFLRCFDKSYAVAYHNEKCYIQ